MPAPAGTRARTPSRIISGVFPHSIHGGDDNPAEKEILRNANFGLARIRLNSKRNLGLSRRNLLPTSRVQDVSLAPVKPRNTSVWRKIGRRIVRLVIWAYVITRASITFIVGAIGLIESLYVACAVPLRIGFFYDPWRDAGNKKVWTPVLTAFTSMDVLSFWVRVWLMRQELRAVLRKILVLFCIRVADYIPRESSVLNALRTSIIGDELSFRSGRWSGNSARGDRVAPHDAIPLQRKPTIHRRQHHHQVPMSVKTMVFVLSCFPWEVTVAFHDFNLLHLICLMYFPRALWNVQGSFSTAVLGYFRSSRTVQMLSFSSIGTIGFLFVTGMYLAHVAACGYMFMAHWECGTQFDHCHKLPLASSWVLMDNLENGSLYRKYARALYWGCKTVTTLGQGDLVPASIAETVYRIFVQFASGLWATAILTAYSFHFSHKDVNMTRNIATRHEQTMKVSWSHVYAKRCVKVDF